MGAVVGSALPPPLPCGQREKARLVAVVLIGGLYQLGATGAVVWCLVDEWEVLDGLLLVRLVSLRTNQHTQPDSQRPPSQ